MSITIPPHRDLIVDEREGCESDEFVFIHSDSQLSSGASILEAQKRDAGLLRQWWEGEGLEPLVVHQKDGHTRYRIRERNQNTWVSFKMYFG